MGIFLVLKKGDVAVQAGVCLDKENSQAFDMARAVGRKGVVIAIEPDPVNLRKLRKYAKRFRCRFIIVDKALYSQSGEMTFEIASAKKVNRLDGVPDSKGWSKNPKHFTHSEKIKVRTESLDNILRDSHINPGRVRHVNLTINGAEYQALKGMTNLLKDSNDLSLTVIAGRRKGKKDDMVYIDGERDKVVIARFLQKFGFRTKFRSLFHKGSYGYVIATKGNMKRYM